MSGGVFCAGEMAISRGQKQDLAISHRVGGTEREAK